MSEAAERDKDVLIPFNREQSAWVQECAAANGRSFRREVQQIVEAARQAGKEGEQ